MQICVWIILREFFLEYDSEIETTATASSCVLSLQYTYFQSALPPSKCQKSILIGLVPAVHQLEIPPRNHNQAPPHWAEQQYRKINKYGQAQKEIGQKI